jgi:hypothetical protein
VTVDLHDTDRTRFNNARLDAFGISHAPLGNATSPSNTADFRIDDLTYTVFGADPGYMVADANGDGRVDVSDLGILATNFNESPPDPAGRPGGDFSGGTSTPPRGRGRDPRPSGGGRKRSSRPHG